MPKTLSPPQDRRSRVYPGSVVLSALSRVEWLMGCPDREGASGGDPHEGLVPP